MNTSRWAAAIGLILTLNPGPSAQAQVGLQRLSLDGGRAPVALFYPTAQAAAPQRFGPYELMVAPGAAPSNGPRALALLSHGTGGSELGHAWLAERLAAAGWIVLAIRHAGDNHEDRSGVARADYLSERPRQLSRALDGLLAHPDWAARVDPRRIVAIGHSAGGHTVLALAGGRPDRQQLVSHCAEVARGAREDAAMCGLAPRRDPTVPAATAVDGEPEASDRRIRAVVALAPLGQGLARESLGSIRLPVHLETAGRDEVLAPAWHGRWLCQAMPAAACIDTPHAGHFASFHPVSQRLGPPGLDPAWDPQGFDRRDWQRAAGARIQGFLERATAVP